MAFEILDAPIMDTGITVGRILITAIIVFAGVMIARIARLVFKKRFATKMTVDSAKSLDKLIYYGIIIIFLLAATASQGIDISGLIVAGGFMGIVIGFAAQSVVSNLISGLFLMIEKPVKQGNQVELPDSNIIGTLIDINTFSSRIQQFDGTVIRIPNEKMFTSNIRTFALSEIRRSDVTVGIAYKEDINKAIAVMKEAIEKNVTYSLMEPAPTFWVAELADSSVNIWVRVWHPRDDLTEVMPILLTVIKDALDKEGIEIPFPQRVIWKNDPDD